MMLLLYSSIALGYYELGTIKLYFMTKMYKDYNTIYFQG